MQRARIHCSTFPMKALLGTAVRRVCAPKVFPPKVFGTLREFATLAVSDSWRKLQNCNKSDQTGKSDFSRYSASTIMTPHCKEFHFGDYDAIGFDLDGTLLRYNLNEMVQLEYELLCSYLVTVKGYPKELLSKPLDKSFLQKGLLIDAENGNILKLSANAAIIRAAHGTRLLSEEEIIETYGIDRKWSISTQFFENPLSTWNGPASEKMRTLLDFFDYPVSYIFALAVDIADAEARAAGLSQALTYRAWPDLLDGLVQIYKREHFVSGESGYFSALRAAPERYIMRTNDSVLKLLRELREAGKAIYMLTGSNVDFANFTATQALGPNWQQLFDCVVFYAKKPGFFTMERPYLRIQNESEVIGSEINFKDVLKLNTSYTQGNWVQLRNTLAAKMGKTSREIRSLYVGDNLIQDIYTPVKHHDYDALAVCEELLVEEGSESPDYEFRDIVHSKFWGSYFCVDGERTLWASVIDKYSQLCIPTIDTVAVDQPLTHKFHAENPDGYYPKPPAVLAP